MMPASAPAAPVRGNSAAAVRRAGGWRCRPGASRAGGWNAATGGAPGRALHARGAASGASITRGLRRRSSSPCRSNTPRRRAGDAACVSGRAASCTTRLRNRGGPGRSRPCTRFSLRRNRPPRRCRRPAAPRPWRACPDAPMPQGLALPPGTFCRHGRRPAERDQRLRGALESRMDGLLWADARGPAASRPARRVPQPVGRGFQHRWSARWSSACPRGWTPTPRWPGRATNWSRTCRCWARRMLSGGVYALVGPTGVGKTTTLAKLARAASRARATRSPC